MTQWDIACYGSTMARWDPGTEERLKRAALDLFTEHGYDDVTVTHIAERAGITRRSYFRYFPDKREVLFAGSDGLPPALAEAVAAADASLPPLAAVLDAFTRVGAELVEHLDHVAERRAVIEASAELQERERTKTAALGEAVEAALRGRGVEADAARLVTHIGNVVFQNAFARWAEAGGEQDFASCLQAVTESLRDTLGAAAGYRSGG